jgi:hypothetical protein
MSSEDMQGLLEKYDSRDMAGYTRRFIDDFENAVSSDLEIPKDVDWTGVVCLGMGGSGAGGMYLSTLADHSGGIPFVVWRDYGLPSWWGPDWLIIATSYSGNTEETLDGVNEALESGGTVIGISSGGELEKILLDNDEFNCARWPNASFGFWSFIWNSIGNMLGPRYSRKTECRRHILNDNSFTFCISRF